jgi:hypothetical protein
LKNNAIFFKTPVFERFVKIVYKSGHRASVLLDVRDDKKLHATLLVEGLEER